LRAANEATAPSAIIAEHVSALLSLAVERIRAGDHSEAFARLAEALKHDPGISILETASVDEVLRRYLPQILASARFPSPLTSLAAISREVANTRSSDALLLRYLELVP